MAVRHYRFALTVDGLVHIGNGNTYGKADYFLDNGKLAILDVESFVAKLDPEQLNDYCQFLEYGVGAWRGGGSGFEDFLDSHGDLRAIARKSVAYRVDARLARTKRNSYSYYDVKEFVKDAQGNPYVPGSSVKGMLRTALLTCIVLGKRKDYERLYDSRRVVSDRRFELTRADSAIMRRAFWRERPDADDRNVVNDVMRYVSVSDSEPLSVDDLVFASKYDRFSKLDDGLHKVEVNGQVDRSGNGLNIYRECLRPGTRVSVDVDVDDRIERYLDGLKLDAKGLESVFSRSFELYEQRFLDHFDEEDDDADSPGAQASSDGICCYIYQSGPLAGMRCRNHAVEGSRYCNVHKDKAVEESKSATSTGGVTCYLGGGVDFDSKTIVNALFEDDRRRVDEISRILYAQFHTRIDTKFNGPQARNLRNLANRVQKAGFKWFYMRAQFYKDGRLKKAKDDHRHWRDPELEVSPHTLKYGTWNGAKYLMGRCTLAVEARA